jgi:hypothetical protein
MAKYRVKLIRGKGEDKEVTYIYVTAPDTRAGYQKAANKAEGKLEALNRPGFQAVNVVAVG